MSIIPYDIPKYQYAKTRFFEREHGIEFTKFELEQMKKFSESRKQDRVEISGYVVWSRPPYFLLIPTSTTTNGSIICKVENGLSYPDLNQYSTIRGNWQYDIILNKTVKVLLVIDIDKTKHDFGKIKPDISPKDFIDILFEKWRNIRGTTKALIAQDFVSSPTSTVERTGGFTLTIASYSKSNALSMFLGDLNRFIPKDFTKNKSLSFKIPELGTTANLPKFGWDDNVANVEKIPKNIDTKLDRIPKSMDECSITLLQKTMGPFNFDARGLVKSDYPIIIEEHVERNHVSYDVDPEIYKFILTTRLSSPTVSLDIFNEGIEKNRKALSTISETFESFSERTGNNQFLDLGHKGKPLSIHNLALSFGRSNSIDSITLDSIEKASKVYLKNIENVMEVQEMWGYDEIPASAVLSIEQRRVWKYLRDNSNRSENDIAENLELPIKEVQKTIQTLLSKSTIIESEFGKYTAVSQK
ncbi:hypothetical protein [Nitrosopumilus sp.]|uniref:hypothetical protein n=1 Tax=Nitrosopumilus sp. TaxID=2024843 RepID=UPI00349FFBA2